MKPVPYVSLFSCDMFDLLVEASRCTRLGSFCPVVASRSGGVVIRLNLTILWAVTYCITCQIIQICEHETENKVGLLKV